MLRLICAASVEVAYQSAQIHFRVSSLKTTLHRSLRQFLELIRARALQEKIGIATDVLNRSESDRIDRSLTVTCPAAGNPAIR